MLIVSKVIINYIIWFQINHEINIEEPEPIDNILQSLVVDDVENYLNEALNDISISTKSTQIDTNTNISCSENDILKTSEPESFIEQTPIENIIPSILPMSIPCSIGSLPTPCAPVFDDLRSTPTPEIPFESLTPFSDEQLAKYYQNKLLLGLQEYIEEFNQLELNNFQTCEHPLDTLLQNYLHARIKLDSINQEIKESKYSYITHKKHIWTLEPATYTQYGECQVNI